MEIKIPRRLIRDGYIQVSGPPWKKDHGEGRYTLFIPVALLDDPSTQILLRDEFVGLGYEAPERRLIDELLPEGCLFLDIGAHWGIYSLHVLAASVGARVVAVEPDPTNLTHLRYNLAANDPNGRATVVDAAVADQVGTRWLRRNTTMGHHLVKTPPRKGGETIEVPVVTIDDLVTLFDPTGDRPIWIKMDIEGREKSALEGAGAVLRSGRVAGILWESSAGGMVNPDAKAIALYLLDHGLETHEINADYRLSIPSKGPAPNLRAAGS